MDQTSKHPDYALLGVLVGCFAAAFVGAECALQGLGGWYMVIVRPAWALRVAAFVPSLMLAHAFAAAAFLSARGARPLPGAANASFWALIALQTVWSWLFFMVHSLAFALGVAVLGWALALGVTVFLFKQRPQAGIVFLPFVIWIAYLAAFNLETRRLNVPGGSSAKAPLSSYCCGIRNSMSPLVAAATSYKGPKRICSPLSR
jgi:tryptophan-rich sensory protein